MLQEMYKEKTVEAMRELLHTVEVALQEDLGSDRKGFIHHEAYVKWHMRKVMEVYTEWSVLRCHDVKE